MLTIVEDAQVYVHDLCTFDYLRTKLLTSERLPSRGGAHEAQRLRLSLCLNLEHIDSIFDFQMKRMCWIESDSLNALASLDLRY